MNLLKNPYLGPVLNLVAIVLLAISFIGHKMSSTETPEQPSPEQPECGWFSRGNIYQTPSGNVYTCKKVYPTGEHEWVLLEAARPEAP